jgi:predicted PurR-regulated permease PerM
MLSRGGFKTCPTPPRERRRGVPGIFRQTIRPSVQVRRPPQIELIVAFRDNLRRARVLRAHDQLSSTPISTAAPGGLVAAKQRRAGGPHRLVAVDQARFTVRSNFCGGRSVNRLPWVIIGAALVLAAAQLFVVTVGTLLLVFAGVLFGVLLGGLSRWLTRYAPLSYRASYLLVALVVVLLIGLGSYYSGSHIVLMAAQLSQELRSAFERTLVGVQQYSWAPNRKSLDDLMVQGGIRFVPTLQALLTAISWAVTGAVVIFFVGFYVAFDPHLYTSGLVKLIRHERRGRATEVLKRLRWVLERWLLGRFVSMIAVGICTAIGLMALGVPLPGTLGIVAALLTFIPNIGPVLGAVPQVLLALEVGANTVYWVVLFNIVLQAAESYLLTPMIERYEVELPPALTITVQLILAGTIGFIGLVTAAPLTAAVLLVIQTLYIRDRLVDPSPGQLVDRSKS